MLTGAGQAAIVRGMEILQNLGCDIRILQLDADAKDPDEYIIKYGSGRFEKCVENAISLVEFKVKILKKTLKIDTASDKIKFLNEIAKILSKVDNSIEREIYIDKISKEYKISKEAIYGESNKLKYADSQGIKILQNPVQVKVKQDVKKAYEENEALIKRENMIISLLINTEINAYPQISKKIRPEDFKLEENRKIANKLYEHFEKGDSNNILDLLEEQPLIDHITSIMADDFEIADNNKAIDDLIGLYEKEKLINKKNEIVEKLKREDVSKEESMELEEELSKVIIQIAKMK